MSKRFSKRGRTIPIISGKTGSLRRVSRALEGYRVNHKLTIFASGLGSIEPYARKDYGPFLKAVKRMKLEKHLV